MRVSSNRDGVQERKVITACATNKTVLAAVADRWDDKDGFLNSRHGNIIVGWCVDYYKKFHKAPKGDLETIYDAWAKKTQDKELAKSVESLMLVLSTEYAGGKKVQEEYTIDLAGKLFKAVQLKRRNREIEALIETGEVEKASALAEKFQSVQLGGRAWVKGTVADNGLRKALRRATEPPLVTYPGAIGEFFGDIFRRGGFVVFEGPEKRGKCVDGRTLVALADGTYRTIARIAKEKTATPVLSMIHHRGDKFRTSEVSDFWKNGRKPCVRIRTKSGRTVSTTANHKYLTPDGWKEIGDVKIGEFVAVPKHLGFFGREPLPSHEVRFLAYMMADGGTSGNSCTFTKADPQIVADFKRCCRKMGFSVRQKPSDPITYELSGGSRACIRSRGMNKKSKDKSIPDVVFKLPRPQLAEFIRVFFTCDGSFYPTTNGRKEIELTLASRKLVRDFGLLMTRFGIVFHSERKDATYMGKKFPAWRLCVRDSENVRKFLEEINFDFSKRTNPKSIKVDYKSFLDKFPWQIAKGFYAELKAELQSKGGFYKHFPKKKAGSIREQVAKQLPLMRQSFSAAAGTKTYAKYMNSEVMWDEVVSIRNVGAKETYDLTVPGDENFVAGNVIVHNTRQLTDVAYRAILKGKKVAFFAVGDMSLDEQRELFAGRRTGRPLFGYDTKFNYPVGITVAGGVADVSVENRERPTLTFAAARKSWKKFNAEKGDDDLLRISAYPNYSISVLGLAAELRAWQRHGWTPDLCCVDYLDLLLPCSTGKSETREQIDETWKRARALAQTFNCCVVSGAQTDTDSYTTDVITMKNFSGSKTKNAHVTCMIGLNQNDQEKELGVMRYNMVVRRRGKSVASKVVYAAGCPAVGNPCVISTF